MSAKEKVFQILENHGFRNDQFENIFDAMSEILYEAAVFTEENEPHATNQIINLKDMSSEISNMDSFLENYFSV